MVVKRILILNGPNLNLIGRRETSIYGSISMDVYIEALMKKYAEYEMYYYQSNHEGSLIDQLHSYGYNQSAIVFNPAAYTHTSIALADAVAGIESPVLEVHISDLTIREEFRKTSYIAPYVKERIMGHGLEGYDLAIRYLIDNFSVNFK